MICQIAKISQYFFTVLQWVFQKIFISCSTGLLVLFNCVFFIFRGCVVGPTFHFDVYELNFGDVAFGETYFIKLYFMLPHQIKIITNIPVSSALFSFPLSFHLHSIMFVLCRFV